MAGARDARANPYAGPPPSRMLGASTSGRLKANQLSQLQRENKDLDAQLSAMRTRIAYLAQQEEEFEKAIAAARAQKDEALARKLEQRQAELFARVHAELQGRAAADDPPTESSTRPETRGQQGEASTAPHSPRLGSAASASRIVLPAVGKGRLPSAKARGDSRRGVEERQSEAGPRVRLSHKPGSVPKKPGEATRGAALPRREVPRVSDLPATLDAPDVDLSTADLEAMWAELQCFAVDDGVDLGVPLEDVVSAIHGVPSAGALDRLVERWAGDAQPLREALREARELGQADWMRARKQGAVTLVAAQGAGAWG